MASIPILCLKNSPIHLHKYIYLAKAPILRKFRLEFDSFLKHNAWRMETENQKFNEIINQLNLCFVFSREVNNLIFEM